MYNISIGLHLTFDQLLKDSQFLYWILYQLKSSGENETQPDTHFENACVNRDPLALAIRDTLQYLTANTKKLEKMYELEQENLEISERFGIFFIFTKIYTYSIVYNTVSRYTSTYCSLLA